MKDTLFRSPWKGTMTARERFNAQMHYDTIDRCFNREFGYWDENFRVWRLFRDNGITTNDAADAFFGFDRMPEVSGCVWLHPSFSRTVLEERDTTRIERTPDGLIAEVPKDGHETIPHYLGSTVVTPEDWQRVKEERLCLDDPARIIDLEVLQRMHPPEREYPLGIHCGSMIGKIRDLLTLEGLAYAWCDYPAMVEDMVETACSLVEHMLDQVLPVIDFDFAAGWEDICCKNGPLVTVDFFRSVVVPRYKRISTRLRNAGIDIWYTDCDGDVRPLLPYFLEGGINCMFPHEVASSGHPADVFARYGPTLRIMGGVDKMALARGPDAIAAYLRSLEPLVAAGGYIPFCDHRCPPDVKEEYYIYYLDLKEQLFGMR